MAKRFIRPTITVIALTGILAVGALYFVPGLTQKVFTQKVVATNNVEPALTIQPIVSEKLPADQFELNLLADALKREQDAQAKELSAVAPAAGDAQR